MIGVERIGLRVGCTTNGRHPGWIRSFGEAAQVLAAIPGFGALYLAWTITGSPTTATEYAMFALVAISGIGAFAARWAQGALADRLDMLSRI